MQSDQRSSDRDFAMTLAGCRVSHRIFITTTNMPAAMAKTLDRLNTLGGVLTRQRLDAEGAELHIHLHVDGGAPSAIEKLGKDVGKWPGVRRVRIEHLITRATPP